jgi:hypothetical protein
MSKKIRLPINIQELCNAFEDSSDDHRYYLDLKTGGITLDFMEAEEREEFDEMLDEASKERYIFLPNAKSQIGYEDMKDELVMERVNEWLDEEGIEIIPQKPIEIREISPCEISESKEIEESWKGFCARGCLDCDNEDEFKERYFVISRCPDSEEEEHWLEEELKKKYGLKHHGITAGIFNDNRGLINSAVCGKCGSHDIFFDF